MRRHVQTPVYVTTKNITLTERGYARNQDDAYTQRKIWIMDRRYLYSPPLFYRPFKKEDHFIHVLRKRRNPFSSSHLLNFHIHDQEWVNCWLWDDNNNNKKRLMSCCRRRRINAWRRHDQELWLHSFFFFFFLPDCSHDSLFTPVILCVCLSQWVGRIHLCGCRSGCLKLKSVTVSPSSPSSDSQHVICVFVYVCVCTSSAAACLSSPSYSSLV